MESNRVAHAISSLALVLVVCFAAQTAQAAAVVVGTCKAGVHFTTIGAAVAAAPLGATVNVCPGVYPEQVTITQSLKLVGIVDSLTGHNAAVVVSPPDGVVANTTDLHGFPVAAQILVDGTSNVTVSNLTIDGSNNGLTDCATDLEGIFFKNSSGTISNNALRNQILAPELVGCQDGLAIFVEANSPQPVSILTNSIRNYDKGGIVVDGPGPNATIKGNTVIGIGATDQIAQNGIQVAYGATATITSNNVADNIYTGAFYGSSGILIYGSSGVTVTSNTVDSTQYAIVTVNSPTDVADGTTITLNHIGGTQTFDAIDLCSSGNIAKSNIIHGSAQSAIHTDDECPTDTATSGNNNTVSSNTINEACAGILFTGTGNTLAPNKYYNVNFQTLPGNSCPAAPVAKVGKAGSHSSRRPSPYKGGR